MDSIKITTYKGYDIFYEEWRRRFVAILPDSKETIRDATTQGELEKKLDNMVTKSRKIEPPIPVFTRHYGENYKLCYITSYDTENNLVWIKDGKDRRKEGVRDVFADNPGNRDRIESIKKNRDDANRLSNEYYQIVKELEPFDVELLERKQ